MLKTRIIWSRCLWQIRTGAFGFYAEGPSRLCSAAVRAVAPGARQPLRSAAAAAAVGLGLPAILGLADLAGSTGIAARSGLVEGRVAAEVSSLSESLERYYRYRETGTWESGSGREVAVTLTVTGYTSRAQETDDTPFVTAANTRTRPGVIALSRDLITRYTPDAPFKFGDVIHISGLGDFVVEDSMHGRWERRADIWFPELAAARAFGRRTMVVTGPYGLAQGQKLNHPTFLASADGSASR